MTMSPPPSDQCPSCSGISEHDGDCPLVSLNIARAAELGLDAATDEVKSEDSHDSGRS